VKYQNAANNAVQIIAAANPTNKPRLKLALISLPPNGEAHWPGAATGAAAIDTN
jgi:hypothetical protein